MTYTLTLHSSYDDLDISVISVAPNGASTNGTTTIGSTTDGTLTDGISTNGSPKAVIQLAHGMCGCKERFIPFMEYMAANGIACVAGDHRGHGHSIKSTDDLGYMYEGGYRALVEDMRMINAWIHEKFPGAPVYLLGHSMGSMAARVYTKQDDTSIDGLILCGSPSWNPMAWVGYALSSALCMIGMGHTRMTTSQRITSNSYNRRFASEGYQAWVCSDQESRKELENNPLGNFYMTANGSRCVMGLMIETYRQGRWAVRNPLMPVIFISGDNDPMMRGERNFHKAAQNLCDRGYRNVSSSLYQAM